MLLHFMCCCGELQTTTSLICKPAEHCIACMMRPNLHEQTWQNKFWDISQRLIAVLTKHEYWH